MKTCADCDTQCPDTAVTCSECGSLFPEMIGAGVVEPDDARAEPAVTSKIVDARSPETASANSVNVCRECGAVGDVTQRRCARCGSASLALRLKTEVAAGGPRKGKRLSAWARRPQVGVLDRDTPDVTKEFALTFLALAGFKLLVLSYIGGMLVFGRTGPAGLQPATFEWRFALAPVAFLNGFLAAVGAFWLYRASRVGALMLGTSFGLDVLLLAWLVGFNMANRLVIWPSAGPYITLALFCAYCAFEVFGKALRGNLR